MLKSTKIGKIPLKMVITFDSDTQLQYKLHFRKALIITLRLIYIICLVSQRSLQTFRPSDAGYTGMFSNRSVFISLRFQIDPLWIAY